MTTGASGTWLESTPLIRDSLGNDPCGFEVTLTVPGREARVVGYGFARVGARHDDGRRDGSPGLPRRRATPEQMTLEAAVADASDSASGSSTALPDGRIPSVVRTVR